MHRIALVLVAVCLAAVAVGGLASEARATINYGNVQVCLNGGWKHVLRANGTAFQSQFQCQQYAVFGGTIVRCAATNTDTGETADTLQTVVDEANAGDTIDVRGTCTGTTTISKNLTITGQQANAFIAPTLDGNKKGSVLTITSTVTINSITITNGLASIGGGIFVDGGSLALNDSTVRGNSSIIPTGGTQEGAGIYGLFGSVTLNDSSVSYNTANAFGGGIVNNDGTLVLNGFSSVDHNSGTFGGGVFGSGVTMNGNSKIHDNIGVFGGGGIDGGPAVLNDDSSVYGNSAGVGGGVLEASTLTMNDNSTIHDNRTTGGGGGGIFVFSDPPFVNGSVNGAVAAKTCPPATGENVYCNSPDNIFTGVPF